MFKVEIIVDQGLSSGFVMLSFALDGCCGVVSVWKITHFYTVMDGLIFNGNKLIYK